MASSVKFAKAYRTLGRPKLQTKSTFCFRAEKYSAEVCSALLELNESQAGRFDEVLVDHREIDIARLGFIDDWSVLEFTYKISSAGEADVYKNFDGMLTECKAIVRGEFPKELYLIDEDLCSEDDELADIGLENLKSLCKLIICLADLAHYHDEKLKGEEYRLVFVEDDGAKGARTIILQPGIDKELLGYNVNCHLLEALLEQNFDKNPHIVKERSIFRASLIEFAKGQVDPRERFRLLVLNWGVFLKLYNNNLDTYLSGFSFHKAKQEVGSAELSIADQLSKLISDVSGKVLSIPISLLALIAIIKAGSSFESAVLVLGITLTSFIMAETISAQKMQFNRISHSRMLLFSAHEKKIEIYPEDLQKYLRSAIQGLKNNEKALSRSLLALRCLVWIPSVAAVTLHAFIYSDELITSWRIIESAVGELSGKFALLMQGHF